MVVPEPVSLDVAQVELLLLLRRRVRLEGATFALWEVLRGVGASETGGCAPGARRRAKGVDGRRRRKKPAARKNLRLRKWMALFVSTVVPPRRR